MNLAQKLCEVIKEALHEMDRCPEDSIRDIWNEKLEEWQTGLRMDHHFNIDNAAAQREFVGADGCASAGGFGMNATIDEIKGQTLAVLNEWACRYEPEMFEFLGLPDSAVAKFAHGMIEKIRADIVEAWAMEGSQ